MANYATLKAAIASAIHQNGNNEITGQLLQQQLLAMVNSLGVGYQYAGIAKPATNPGTPDENVFYLASTAGTYTNFGGLVLSDGEIAILKYNGAWTKNVTGTASAEKLSQLSQEVWNNHLVGNGNNYVFKDIKGFVPGRKYRLILKDPEWSMAGVSTESVYKFTIRSSYNGVQTNIINVAAIESVNKYYDFVIPENSDYVRIGGRAAVGTNIDFNIYDITQIGALQTKDDAEIFRAQTGSVSTEDSPLGTRIRAIVYVIAGTKVYISTTDPGGYACGVWDTKGHAAWAGTTGRLQQITEGYAYEPGEYEVTAAGYMCISLTNGTTAIDTERKQEMIDSLVFGVGGGIEYGLFINSIATKDNENRIAEIVTPSPKGKVYYGEKIRLDNSFDFSFYSTNIIGGQSSARWGEHLFIVEDRLTRIACYNLQDKRMRYILTTGITGASYWHCNQSSFGRNYYDANDMFPVLYISMQNNESGRCTAQGYRIVPILRDGKITSFTIELVQTIYLPVMTDENCLGNVNVTFDIQEGYMWGYGRNNNTAAENYAKARIVKFAIPDLFDGSNNVISSVVLSDSDILDSFSDDWSMYNAQGGFIQNGKLVIMQGYQNAGYINCRVIDLYVQQKQVSMINLLANGFTEEPEGVFYYNGKIMTQTGQGNIIQLDIL